MQCAPRPLPPLPPGTLSVEATGTDMEEQTAERLYPLQAVGLERKGNSLETVFHENQGT